MQYAVNLTEKPRGAMQVLQRVALAVALLLLFSHCGPFPQRSQSHASSEQGAKHDSNRSSTRHRSAAVPAQNNSLAQKFQTQFRAWKGVPYRLGGNSKAGIDCSGFVFLTFKKHFGITLPRSTGAQVRTGRSVTKSKLRTGDLVFFKTGFLTRHVGIYLDNNRFMHASTSRGVMISRFNSSYWQNHYWQSRRILN